ncbi:MAG: S-layer homology domain-containing protein, partial [Clostridia bacterium]|nr:S-layer homology domain-containing protein [Clostridia bacterium]
LKISSTVSSDIFWDVPSDSWYADAVVSAASAGLIVGYDGYFRPDDFITREEMAVVIAKAYSYLGKEANRGKISMFSDIDEISSWAKDYVDQAASAGLVSGVTATTFSPQENTTRAQVTSLIKRLLEN